MGGGSTNLIFQIYLIMFRTRDENGRSLLHIAASLGKIKILEWLLRFKVIHINLYNKTAGPNGLKFFVDTHG